MDSCYFIHHRLEKRLKIVVDSSEASTGEKLWTCGVRAEGMTLSAFQFQLLLIKPFELVAVLTTGTSKRRAPKKFTDLCM